MGTNEVNKNCPFCGEEILRVAKKCKHCGEMIDEKSLVASAEKNKTYDDYKNDFVRMTKSYFSNNEIEDDSELFYGNIPEKEIAKAQKVYAPFNPAKENLLFISQVKTFSIIDCGITVTDEKLYYVLKKPMIKTRVKGFIKLSNIDSIHFENSNMLGEGSLKINGVNKGWLVMGGESADYLNLFFTEIISSNLFINWRTVLPQVSSNFNDQNKKIVDVVEATDENNKQNASEKSRLVVFLLNWFFGYLGIHRFYTGKVGTGILYFCTFGLFGIGWVVDFISILFGVFKDHENKTIKNW